MWCKTLICENQINWWLTQHVVMLLWDILSLEVTLTLVVSVCISAGEIFCLCADGCVQVIASVLPECHCRPLSPGALCCGANKIASPHSFLQSPAKHPSSRSQNPTIWASTQYTKQLHSLPRKTPALQTGFASIQINYKTLRSLHLEDANVWACVVLAKLHSNLCTVSQRASE